MKVCRQLCPTHPPSELLDTDLTGTITAVYKGDNGGFVITTEPGGFGGAVKTMVGIDADGTITGLRVTGHSETAGLGAKATDPSFYEQFTGKSGSVSVTKDGGEIVPITSATITSRAVCVGAQEALDWVAANGGALLMANPIKIIKNGIINENPTFVQVIGMCPTLAVTSSAINGIGMGLSTTAVLDFCEPVYLSAEKGNSRYSTYPLLYRCYCYIRNNHRVPAEGLSARTERISGSVHSTDRSKLSDSGRAEASASKNGPLLPHSMVSVWVLVSPSLWAVWVWCVNSSAAAHCST